MRLYAVFLILNIQLGHIYASPPSSYALVALIRADKKGFECGNIFFHEKSIEKSILNARNLIATNCKLPRTHNGEIFNESNSKKYYLWPITAEGRLMSWDVKYLSLQFGIILAKDSNEQGRVVAKTTTKDYTKCIRWNILPEEPSYPNGEIPNGYLCGRKFFHYDRIIDSIDKAKKLPEGNNMYPLPYTGSLYSKDSGYIIWPLMKRNHMYTFGSANIGPYFLVLDTARELVDVVVRGNNKNLMRCTHSIMPQEAAAPDQSSELTGSLSTFRYLCDNIYFHSGELQKIAKSVEDMDVEVKSGFFPHIHTGFPYNQPCVIWPVMKNRKLYEKGIPGLYRLILTLDYEIMDVAINGPDNILKPCWRTSIIPKIYLDKSDYHCHDMTFTHEQLVLAAEEACPKLYMPSENFFPAKYKGSDFMVAGPYFTYPLFQYGVYRSGRAGFHRVVINGNCEVAGALSRLLRNDNMKPNRFLKCYRSADGSLPNNYFSAIANIVFEDQIIF